VKKGGGRKAGPMRDTPKGTVSLTSIIYAAGEKKEANSVGKFVNGKRGCALGSDRRYDPGVYLEEKGGGEKSAAYCRIGAGSKSPQGGNVYSLIEGGGERERVAA